MTTEFLNAILPLCRVPGDHRQLWEAVYVAQRASAKNNPSISKMLVNLVGQSSGSFIHALTAGFMSVGEKHGPIGKARDDLMMYADIEEARAAVLRGVRIYGFGNSFFKQVGGDPAWHGVHGILATKYRGTFEMLACIQEGIARAGKKIYPNPAGYSAAAAHATGLIRGMEEAIFVMPRMQVWLEEYIITQTVKAEKGAH